MSHLDELNQSVVQEPIRTVMEAVQEDNFELVKLMIDEGVDVDLRDDEGWQAIHYAAWCSEPMRYLKFFLSKPNINLGSLTFRNQNLIHLFCRDIVKRGDKKVLEMVKFLVENGLDPFVPTVDYDLPLHFASQFGLLETVRYLHSFSNTGINEKNSDEETPLMLSIRAFSLPVCTYLCEEGAHLEGANLAAMIKFAHSQGLTHAARTLCPFLDQQVKEQNLSGFKKWFFYKFARMCKKLRNLAKKIIKMLSK